MSIYTINDSMFALILRFIGRNQKVNFCDDEFIKKQLKAIRAYIEKFPPAEQELRAMEWIQEYAHEYRKIWENNILNKEFSDERCADCPLLETEDIAHCSIHQRWLELLEEYAQDKMDSQKYVENTLALLTQNKENLKIKLSALKNTEDDTL